jgi:predicted nuclease of restriction endonuclease-like (RecB) superfamily
MKKKKSSKDQSPSVVQRSTLRLPGSAESSDQIFSAVRGEFYESIAEVLRSARSNAYRAVNFVMVEAYWNIGRMIVEEEQQGHERAEYGAALIESLSPRLTEEFGKGFTKRNLWQMRQFYLVFPPEGPPSQKVHTLCAQLTWSHYRLLMRVEKAEARAWYMTEAANQNWSVRALQRQINSLYYERLLMSRDKTSVVEEMQEKTAPLAPTAGDFIKDPYVLEFLGMPDAHQFREAELEQAIIGKLQAFMVELGKGFAFVARQHRISTETKDFFIDLVFYNYILKCFLLIELKTAELTHEDIGKMDMYVRLFEDTVKGSDDNPTVGLILCTDKDHTVVKYSVLNESRQLFASKYSLYLPTEEELRIEIERERAVAVREQRAMYEVMGR